MRHSNTCISINKYATYLTYYSAPDIFKDHLIINNFKSERYSKLVTLRG